MRYLRSVLLQVGLFSLAAGSAQASGVKIIANPSVKAESISAGELRDVFLEDATSLKDGSHAEPVLEKEGAVNDAFLKQYVNKSPDALRAYYRSLVFTGKGSMPKTLGSDAEVVAFVAKTKGAIGYVGDDVAAAGVKTLAVK